MKKAKTRHLKVYYLSETRVGERYGSRESVQVPYIKLSGRWLKELGFDIGARVVVACSDGKLVITRRDEDV